MFNRLILAAIAAGMIGGSLYLGYQVLVDLQMVDMAAAALKPTRTYENNTSRDAAWSAIALGCGLFAGLAAIILPDGPVPKDEQ